MMIVKSMCALEFKKSMELDHGWMFKAGVFQELHLSFCPSLHVCTSWDFWTWGTPTPGWEFLSGNKLQSGNFGVFLYPQAPAKLGNGSNQLKSHHYLSLPIIPPRYSHR